MRKKAVRVDLKCTQKQSEMWTKKSKYKSEMKEKQQTFWNVDRNKKDQPKCGQKMLVEACLQEAAGGRKQCCCGEWEALYAREPECWCDNLRA